MLAVTAGVGSHPVSRPGDEAAAGPGSVRDSHPRPQGRRGWNPAYLFIAPSLLLIGVFILWPILQTGWMSLHEWTIGEDTHQFLGLRNYSRLFDDPRFFNAVQVTLIYTVGVTIGSVGLGLLCAQALRRTTWYTSAYRVAFFFPYVASLVVIGVVFRFLLDPQVGLLAGVMNRLGMHPIDWLQNLHLALPTVVVIGIWKTFGFSMIVLLAAVQGVPANLNEAAVLDGAGAWQRFRFVTLPSIRLALLFTVVISTITGLRLFDLVYVMTSGGPVFHTESIVTYLYQKGFVDFDLGYASALSWVLFLIILFISMIQLRLLRYRDDD